MIPFKKTEKRSVAPEIMKDVYERIIALATSNPDIKL